MGTTRGAGGVGGRGVNDLAGRARPVQGSPSFAKPLLSDREYRETAPSWVSNSRSRKPHLHGLIDGDRPCLFDGYTLVTDRTNRRLEYGVLAFPYDPEDPFR